MAPWADLLDDLVAAIAERVLLREDFIQREDFIAFGAVCRSWKAAATRYFTRAHHVPWLMLPESEGTSVRDFYDLKNGKVYHLDMPELVRGDVMCYSSLGWLMTLSSDSKVDLLHPFNGMHIELPSIETFKNQHSDDELEYIFRFNDFDIVSKFVLSSNPSLTSDYTVVIHSYCRLAFCKAGDREWTAIDCKIDEAEDVGDIACYNGKVYMVDTLGSIWVCEIEDGKQPKTRVVVPPLPSLVAVFTMNYLVDSAGALLLVERSVGLKPFKFRVHEVPLNTGDWPKSTQVPHLGNKTVFLSYNDSSVCVQRSDYYGCKSNCIYFRELSRAFGYPSKGYKIHHMEDGIIESRLGKTPNSGKCQSVLIEPSF